jgi:hypothetical protein
MLYRHGTPRAHLEGTAPLTLLGDTPPVLRREIAPATLVVAVALEIWLLTGVSLDAIARFSAYEIGFVAVPGVAVLWALRGRPRGLLVSVGFGMPIGYALEILAFSATAAAGRRSLFLLYPVGAVAISALVIWLRRRRSAAAAMPAATDPMSNRVVWMAALALSAGLIYMAVMFIPQAPLPSDRMSVSYIPDFVYEMSKTAEVLYHWPPTNPGLSGVPLPYEWFLFFHMAAVSQVTHLGIPVIALRLDFVPLLLIVGCQLLMVGRAFAGTAAVGVIAVVVVFLLGPLDLTTDASGSPFFTVFSTQLWESWTFPFGLLFFLPLLALIAERLRAATWRTRHDLAAWSLIALLMVGASGAKATILPVLLAGTCLYTVCVCISRRRLPRPQFIVALALEAVIFVITFLIIYRGGAPFTVFGPLVSLGQTLPVIDITQSAMPAAVRAIALPLAYAAGLAGMLLPLAGLLYMLRRRHRSRLRRYALCLSMLGAGLVIANLFHQLGYSELYFQDTGYVAACIVAADGLRLAWLDIGHALPLSRRFVAVATGCWMAALIALVIATTSSNQSQVATVRYAVLIAGGVIFVAGCFLITRMRRHSTSGVLGFGLIPILAASALASPIELAPTAGRIVSGIPTAYAATSQPGVRGLTPDLLKALHWLKAHTSVDAVIAVSNHWLDSANTNGRFYYYSAFSERQVFIEGYDPVRYEITTSGSTAEGADFAERQSLNNQVFDLANQAALSIMTQQYAVRYLLINPDDGDSDDDNPAVLRLGTVVFSNSAATIIAVG